MVNTDGVVKLADFGIAKAAEQSDITKVGSVLGTAAYLSPEQARGEPAGPASDLYALGVVSFQLMAGPPALRGGVADRSRAPAGVRPAAAAARTRCATCRRRWPPPSRARSRATRARRYADAAEMEDALRDGLAGVAHTEDLDATRACPTTTRRGAPSTGTGARARAARCSRSTSRRARRRQRARRRRRRSARSRRRRQVGRAAARAGADRRRHRRLPGGQQRRRPNSAAQRGRQGLVDTASSSSRNSSRRTRGSYACT